MRLLWDQHVKNRILISKRLFICWTINRPHWQTVNQSFEPLKLETGMIQSELNISTLRTAGKSSRRSFVFPARGSLQCLDFVPPCSPECWIITTPRWTRRWSRGKKWPAAVLVGGIFFCWLFFLCFPPRSIAHLFTPRRSLITSCYLWCCLTQWGRF